MSKSASTPSNHPIGSRESADEMFRSIDEGMADFELAAARLAEAAKARLEEMNESQNEEK